MTTRPTENFLLQLEQHLALTEDAAVSTLASWLWSYEPGPLARARRSLANRAADDVSASARVRPAPAF